VSDIEVLESELRTFEIELAPPKKLLLAGYCAELVHWNNKINLTALSGRDMVRRLVVEPLWIGHQLKPQGILADIGSGNGSPAIPLHVLCGFSKVHLIEIRARRAAFLRHIATTLKLSDVIVHRARFEAIASGLEPVDWITLQGVALTEELFVSIRNVSRPTTNVVWISSSATGSPAPPVCTLRVPFTATRVLLFRL
jgi:16S rRNA (guanine(527)-N(7))-methyltransferase RsmG